MDDETKGRFESLDKRLDDMKHHLQLLVAVLLGVFAVVSIIFNINVNAEKDRLIENAKELKKEIKELLGQTTGTPDLTLLTISGEPLQGREMEGIVTGEDLVIPIVMKNSGKADTGRYAIKLYSKKPITLNYASVDEKEFDYETYLSKGTEDRFLPPGIVLSTEVAAILRERPSSLAGKYPVMFKVYYGKGQVVSARFHLVIR